MKKLLLASLLAFVCNGCGALAVAALLSSGEADDLAENFEETIETQQQLAQYATAAARGELDITDYTYDPPTVDNDMTGTLTLNDAELPFGDGNVQVTFKVDGDGAPVDPYAIDLSGMGAVDGTVDVSFSGVSPNGKSLDISSDVDISTLTNDVTDVTALIAGRWNIDLDDYQSTLTSSGMEFDVDLATERVTRAIGNIDGNVDLPNFPVDGKFNIEGLGDKLRVAIDVAVTEIDFDVDLRDIF
jgi:hypothetical protein